MTVMGPEREVQEAFEVLEPIVDNDGGIRATDVVTELVRWMGNAKSFDTRIVFLCVVNQTANTEILGSFLSNGGWLCMAKWLTIFIDKNQCAGIREVLKCLQRLPVTLETLKISVETDDISKKIKMPGKMIRSLRKHDDDTIKKLSNEIYKLWSNLLESDNLKKKKREEKSKVAKKDLNGKRSGPKLADTLMTNMFEVSEEERSRQKLEQKRRKDAKKKKKEEEKSKQAASKNDVIADILTNMPLHVGTENAGDELAPNSSPPIGRDTPSPELVKRQPKPGAKTVRWMDWTTARPLDYVREFEVDPNERVNVNSDEYKMKMELEAFKEGEVLTSSSATFGGSLPESNLGDLAPKRQWRSPRKIANYLTDVTRKNLELWSKDSEEKTAAVDRCSRTLQRIYPRASIPDSPTDPEPRPVPSGNTQIPKIPQQLEETQDTPAASMDTTPPLVTAEPEAPLPAVGSAQIDLTAIAINLDTLRDAVSNANGGQRIPPPQPLPTENMYNAQTRYQSTSPPVEERFGRVHAPTPPRPHVSRSPPPSNAQRYAPYNRRSPPYGRHGAQPPFSDSRRYDAPRDYDRFDRYARDRSPIGRGETRRRSRSPPRYHPRSPPRPHYRDSRDNGYRR